VKRERDVAINDYVFWNGNLIYVACTRAKLRLNTGDTVAQQIQTARQALSRARQTDAFPA